MRVSKKAVWAVLIPVVALVGAAWLEAAVWGVPEIGSVRAARVAAGLAPHGFPAWLRVTHYLNFLFMLLLVRSGLQILWDHPRLYWNVHCHLDSEWIRFTPIRVPRDRVWTAKDDARYLSHWIGLPGGRHTIGIARHWHFASVGFWVLNGVVFAALLFATGQWRRLVPTSWEIVPEAWKYFVHYATLRTPPEPDGFYAYNPLQQIAYFGVVFGLAPLSIVTGLAMSPALTAHWRWYARLFGNRQIARSIHFLLLCAYLAFVAVHVALVVVTGFARNMNHIVLGTDSPSDMRGLWLGLAGIAVALALSALAVRLSWRHPRLVQRAAGGAVEAVMGALLDPLAPRVEYAREDISPYFWPNGKMPVCEEWKRLAAGNFRDYRLEVGGLVENPVELTLEDLRALGLQRQITKHDCIQGWSGIAEWGGVALPKLIALVRPRPGARYLVFHSYGEGGEGGEYYDSHTFENCMHPQSLLAWEMNFAPLSHLHGAPLRLRVENQLGFKQVKWIRSIELVESPKLIAKGRGGYNEDNEYFGCKADI